MADSLSVLKIAKVVYIPFGTVMLGHCSSHLQNFQFKLKEKLQIFQFSIVEVSNEMSRPGERGIGGRKRTNSAAAELLGGTRKKILANKF